MTIHKGLAIPPLSVNSLYFSNGYEEGRSILEVLAVMALVGLLSVGGVEGYQAAMRKLHSNNILEGASQRAIAVSQQMALDKDLDKITLGEFPTNAGRGGSFPTKPKKLNEEFFSLPITGLDEAACEQLKTMVGNGLRRVDCKEENGSVTAELIYHKDLSDTAGDLSGVKTDGSGSGSSATHAYDNDKDGCNGAGYQYCADGTCITKEETCEGGSDLCNGTYPGTSEHNTGGQAGIVEGKTCRCPDGQAFNHNDSKCIVACSGHGALDANEDCVCQGGYCGVVCENQITCQHGTWTPDKCECDANWYGPLCDSDCDGWKGGIPFDYYGDNWRNCHLCSDLTVGSYSGDSSSFEECSRCPNRQLFETYTLYLDDEGDIWIDEKPTKVIGEKTMGFCGLKDCGKNAYRTGINGNCHPCEATTFVADFTTKEECDKCPTRELINTDENGNGICIPKGVY